jgi:adenylate cyclase, class 2
LYWGYPLIEAELKALARDPVTLHSRLRRLAAPEHSTYKDTYFDLPGGDLAGSGRELRLRIVEASGRKRSLLTYKEAPVDAASGSKPEYETGIEDPAFIEVLFQGLGLEHMVKFEKQCTNYRFSMAGRDMLATVVTVPELDGTFIELETMASADETDAALADIRGVLADLGVSDDDITNEQYTDAVLRSRQLG